MKHTYILLVDQETHLILGDAENYDIANKLCEYVLNVSVMHIRTSSVYDPSKNQILLQRKTHLIRPGETSVAKPALIDEQFAFETTNIHKNKTKAKLQIKKEALVLLEEISKRFLSRFTTKYLHYTDEMILEWSKHAEMDFENAKYYIQMQNESYLFAKAKLDGTMFKAQKMIENIGNENDILNLKNYIDRVVYNS